jgi:pyridoxine 4-dehydrogenase
MTEIFALGGDTPVNRIGFGAMRLPRDNWGPSARDPKAEKARDPERGRAVLRRAVQLGVNHIDTARFYRSEDGAVSANTLIREALGPYTDNLVIATKVGPIFTPDGFYQAGPDALRRLVEENLEELGVDRLDLVYLRIGMMDVPHGESIAERFEVLAGLREEGLIRHLGLSNVDTGHVQEARAIAPVVAVQNLFNLSRQDRSDRAVLQLCQEHTIGFAPFGPVGSGREGFGGPAVQEVAARHGISVAQVALAWLLALSLVTLAIAGTGSLEHLEENVAAADVILMPEDLIALAADAKSGPAADAV